jgi:teichuronic acid biosynthesis glycosyltransferase TuaC
LIKAFYIERDFGQGSLVGDQIQRIVRTGGVRPTVCFLDQNARKPFFEPPGGLQHVRRLPFPKLEKAKSFLWKLALQQKVPWLRRPGSFDFDLIHAHFAYPDGWLARWIGKKTDTPYIITGRGSDMLLYPCRSNFLDRAVRNSIVDADMFVGVSESLCNVAVEMGLDPDKCRVQPDGYDQESFWWVPEVEGQRNRHSILFAGRLHRIKNVPSLLEALAMVKTTIPDAKLVIAGDGPQRKMLEDMIGQLKLNKDVSLVGHLSPGQLGEHMRKAGVLVLPSFSEGWGNVVTEALACGLPVVASDLPCIREQLTAPELGLFCDPNSPKDLAEKIIKLIKNPDFQPQSCARHVSELTRVRTAENIVCFYEEMLLSTRKR